MTAQRDWLAIVSAEHAARGRAGGFIQVCHGKAAPLRRIKPGDGIAIYAPTISFGGKDKCQSFVSIGVIRDDPIYPFDMGGGFVPFRRNVDYIAEARQASILPLREALELTRGKRNWGYAFRFGLLAISEVDMKVIAAAMGVSLQTASGRHFDPRDASAIGASEGP